MQRDLLYYKKSVSSKITSSSSQWAFPREKEKLFIKFTGNKPCKLARTAAAPSVKYNMWEALHFISYNNRIFGVERDHKDHLVPNPPPPRARMLSTRPGCSELYSVWLPLFKLLSETGFTFRRHWHFLRRKHRVGIFWFVGVGVFFDFFFGFFFFHKAEKEKKNTSISLMMLENKMLEKKILVKMYSLTFQFPYRIQFLKRYSLFLKYLGKIFLAK